MFTIQIQKENNYDWRGLDAEKRRNLFEGLIWSCHDHKDILIVFLEFFLDFDVYM